MDQIDRAVRRHHRYYTWPHRSLSVLMALLCFCFFSEFDELVAHEVGKLEQQAAKERRARNLRLMVSEYLSDVEKIDAYHEIAGRYARRLLQPDYDSETWEQDRQDLTELNRRLRKLREHLALDRAATTERLLGAGVAPAALQPGRDRQAADTRKLTVISEHLRNLVDAETADARQDAAAALQARLFPEPATPKPAVAKAAVKAHRIAAADNTNPALIARLGTEPAAIFAQIRNQIRYQPYQGSLRTAEQTLQDQCANDIDQAKLLVRALQRAGVDCRFVEGALRLSTAQACDWLAVDELGEAHALLQSGGVTSRMIQPENGKAELEVEHVWVEARFDADSETWTAMAPALKKHRRSRDAELTRLAVADADALLTNIRALARQNKETHSVANLPDELIGVFLQGAAQRMRKHLAKTGRPTQSVLGLAEVAAAGRGIVPLDRVCTKADARRRSPHAPADNELTITLHDADGRTILKLTAPVTAFVDNSLTIAYEPAGPADRRILEQLATFSTVYTDHINVAPVVRLNATEIARGDAVAFGSQQTLDVQVGGQAANPVALSDQFAAGGTQVLTILAPQAGPARLQASQRRLNNPQGPEALLDALALSVAYTNDRVLAAMNANTPGVQAARPMIVRAGFEPDCDRLFDRALAAVGSKVVVRSLTSESAPAVAGLTTDAVACNLLAEAFELPAVSGASLFRDANLNLTAVHTVNATTLKSLAPGLAKTHGHAFMQDLHRVAANGHTALVPAKPLSLNSRQTSMALLLESSGMARFSVPTAAAVLPQTRPAELPLSEHTPTWKAGIEHLAGFLANVDQQALHIALAVTPATAAASRWQGETAAPDPVVMLATMLALNHPLAQTTEQPAILNVVANTNANRRLRQAPRFAAASPIERQLRRSIDNFQQTAAAVSSAQEESRHRERLAAAGRRLTAALQARRTELEHRDVSPTELARHDEFVAEFEARLQADLAAETEPAAAPEPATAPTTAPLPAHRRADELPDDETTATLSSAPTTTLSGVEPTLTNNPESPTLYPILDRVTMAQVTGDATADDLLPTPEAPHSDAITALAAELQNNPLAIYEFVRNQIAFEPYYGLMKGADQTLLEKAGNDADAAALTAALMRSAGIPCRYVYGVVEIPIAAAMEMVGAKDANLTVAAFSRNGIPSEAVYTGGAVTANRMDHVWTRIWINPHPYLGAAAHNTGKRRWIECDPTLKLHTFTPHRDVTAEVGFDADTFLTRIKEQSTVNDAESWAQNIPEDYIISDLETVGGQVKDFLDANDLTAETVYRAAVIKPDKPNALPLAAEWKTEVVAGAYRALPPEFSYQLVIRLRNSTGEIPITHETTMAEVLGKRLTLSYVPATADDQTIIDTHRYDADFPAYLVNLIPQLKLDGVLLGEGPAIGMGWGQSLTIDFVSPKESFETVTHDVKAGGYYAVGLNAQTIPADLIDARHARLKQAGQALDAGNPVDPDDIVGEVLHLTGLNYYHQIDKLNRTAAGALEVTFTRRPSELLVAYDLDVEELYDAPYTVRSPSVTVDVKRDLFVPVSVNGSTAAENQFMITSAMSGSAIEHNSLQQMYNATAVSTVRIIQAANDQGVRTYTMDAANADAILPLLSNHSQASLDDMANRINAGAVVTVPETPITYGDWSGAAYIALDPDTGASEYLLEKAINGGETIVSILGPPALLGMGGQTEYQDLLVAPNDWLRVMAGATAEVAHAYIPAIASINRWFADVNNLDKAATVAACIAISGPITKYHSQPAIVNVASDQLYISPNGDGVSDSITFAADVTRGAEWTLTITGPDQTVVDTRTGATASLNESFGGDQPALAEGTYGYAITAEANGIQAPPVSGEFKVDLTAPTAVVTAPSVAAGETRVTVDAAMNVSGTATDLNFAGLKLALQPVNGEPVNVFDGAEPVVGGVINTVDTAAVANGEVDLILTVTDLAGNVGSATVPLTIDNPLPDTTAPTVTLTITADGQVVTDQTPVGGTLDIQAGATDDTAVTAMDILLDGTVIASGSADSLQTTVDTVTLTNAQHTITATASDAAGNTGEATQTVSTSSPIAAFTIDPETATPDNATVSITADLAQTADWTLAFTGPSTIADITGTGTAVQGTVDATQYNDGAYTATLTVAGLTETAAGAFNIDLVDLAPKADITSLANDTDEFERIIPAYVRDGLIDLRGTASDPDASDTVKYRVVLESVPGSQLVADLTPGPVDADNWHVGRVTNGSLGEIDFTMTENGLYDLVLYVTDGTRISSDRVRIVLDSALKVGQFSFSQQDILVPVNGMPITVIRTYNSLKTDASSDFGPGWTYAINDMELSVSEERSPWTAADGAQFSLRTGGSRDVTVRLPDGRLATFRFAIESAGWYKYRAVWIAPPGVNATLTPSCSDILVALTGMDPYWEAGDYKTPMENFDFPGYTLKMADGTQYILKREDLGAHYYQDAWGESASVEAYGDLYLEKIIQPSGDVITFHRDGEYNTTGIDHTNAAGDGTRSIALGRDATTNKITAAYAGDQVTAAADGAPAPVQDAIAQITYDYDAATGNLIKVHKLIDDSDPANPVYETIEYIYGNADYPHYITEIKDPRGLSPMKTVYDENGRIEKVIDANGNEIDLAHNVAERSETVTDRMGNATTYIYDARGNVTVIIDPLGNTTKYTYDDRGNELTITNALGHVTKYTYDGNDNRTSVTDPLGNTTRYTYNSKSQQTSVTDPLGHVSKSEYDSAGNLTASVNALNQKTANAYNSANNLTATYNVRGTKMASFSYTGNGELQTTTDINDVTRSFSYDADGNQTGTSFTWTNPHDATDAESISTASVYNAAGQVTQTTDANGNTSYTWYNSLGKPEKTKDHLGNVSITRYDHRGNVVETQSWFGDPTADANWDGRAESTAAGAELLGVSRSVYDVNGRAYVTADRYVPAAHVTDPAVSQNRTGSRSIYDAAGRVVRSERLKNVIVSVQQDPENPNVYTSYYDPAQAVVVSSSQSEYDQAGRTLKSTNTEGRHTRYEYDKAGRQLAVVDHYGNRTEYEYNEAGQQLVVRDALKRETRFEYDALGRRVKTILHDGTFVTTKYNDLGQRVEETDQAGVTRKFEYNEQGQLIKVILPAVEDPENANALTNPEYVYSYNQYGNHEVITDPKGRVTEFRYDHFGRQIARILPKRSDTDTQNRTETSHYDTLGRQVYAVDLASNLTEMVYDSRSRVIRKNKYMSGTAGILPAQIPDLIGKTAAEIAALLPAGVTADEYVEYTYDELGRQTAVTEYKQTVDTATKQINTGLTAFVTQYEYDGYGRMVKLTTAEGWIAYEYDETTGRKTATETANTRTEYGYDELGRLETVSLVKRSGQTLTEPEVTTYAYTEVGSRDYMTLPNGVKTDYTYDNLNRLTELKHEKADGSLLAKYAYDLTPTGRRNGVTETQLENGTLNTVDVNYTYDALNRLQNESYNVGGALVRRNSYTFDLVGNRLQKTEQVNASTQTTTYTYNDADQLISEASDDISKGTTSYTYDVRRSLTTKQNATTGESVAYQYNLDGRLWTADIARTDKDAQGTPHDVATYAGYTYNQAGIRVRKDSHTAIDGGAATAEQRIFLNDPANFTGYSQVLEELDAAGGSPLVTYTIGTDIITQQKGADTTHFLYDGHGSTRLLTDATQAVTDVFNYDAWGVDLGLDWANERDFSPVNEPATKLRYSGEYVDTHLQQQYLRARWYDPANAQVNRLDDYAGSLQEPQSLHKYAYCHGDPVNGIDPSGRGKGLLAKIVVIGLALILIAALVVGFIWHRNLTKDANFISLPRNPDLTFIGFSIPYLIGADPVVWSRNNSGKFSNSVLLPSKNPIGTLLGTMSKHKGPKNQILIIAHSSDGRIGLSTSSATPGSNPKNVIYDENPADSASDHKELADFKKALKPWRELFILGCALVKTEKGRAMIQSLADDTDTVIYASDTTIEREFFSGRWKMSVLQHSRGRMWRFSPGQKPVVSSHNSAEFVE